MRTERPALALFSVAVVLTAVPAAAQDAAVDVSSQPQAAATETALEPVGASAEASPEPQQRFLDRLSVGGGAEVDLVGLAFGARPELLFRPFRPDGRSNLRLAAGVMQGPEITFVPVNLGYRLILSPGRPARAHIGGGLEWQNFWYGGDAPKSRLAMYLETGFEFEIFDGGWVGLQYAPDFALTGFGFGFATRATFRYDL